ncbi:hypothetical protein ACFZ8E_24935 [Methylobacterium sp. HMF5984]|uniref:hypothetical protein n=1 Tax=Methylobacterium sp. HMF5984 TaxID=3367370 RepID=UPI0038522506
MARTRTFITGLDLSLWDGGEQQLVLAVDYEFHPGSKGSWDEPPAGDTAEVTAVRILRDGEHLSVPEWLSGWIEAAAGLLDSLVTHAAEQNDSDKSDAAERRAEADRDDRMMEGR